MNGSWSTYRILILATLANCKPVGVGEVQSAPRAKMHAPDSLSLTQRSGCHIAVMDIAQDDFRYTLYDRLMRLAIARGDDGEGKCNYELVPLMSHARKFSSVTQGKLDIVGNVATKSLLMEFDAIKVPVHMGLHGVRLLVIRKGDESRFANIKTVDELKAMQAGVAHDWQVADVLKENLLPLTPNASYESIFSMLQYGRIDYIPLSIFEAAKEVAKRPQFNLTIEPTVLLIYPSTDYYFVAKNRPDLRARLSQGLSKVIADGSRDALFEDIHQLSATIKASAISERTVLKLTNSSDPPDAPHDVAAYWHPLSR